MIFGKRRAAIIQGLAMFAAVVSAGSARAAGKPSFMAPDGAIKARRTYTDADGKTHCGSLAWRGTPVAIGEASIVPAGCVRYFEDRALSMLIRRFVPGMTTDYHTDPAHEHQVTFMLEGTAKVGARDGSSFLLGPGEFATVEDDHGEGHTAVDATGKGFTQIFVAVPAG